MAVTATPIFTQTPQHGIASPVTTANTELIYSSGAVVTAMTAGANGAKVLSITIMAQDAVTVSNLINIWIDVSGGANSWILFDSHPVSVITPGAGTAPFRKSISYENFVLPAGAQIGASVYVTGDSYSVHVDYGDY